MLQTTEVFPQPQMMECDWVHDVNGALFDKSFKVEKDFPQFANHWFDSIQSSYHVTFKDDEGNTHEATTENGVRCGGCVGVIAFDSEGKGVNYLK